MGIEIVEQRQMESATYLLSEAFEPKYRRRLTRILRPDNEHEIEHHIRSVAAKLANPGRFTEQLVRDACRVVDFAIHDSDEIRNKFELGQFYELCINLAEGRCWRVYDPADLPAWLRRT